MGSPRNRGLCGESPKYAVYYCSGCEESWPEQLRAMAGVWPSCPNCDYPLPVLKKLLCECAMRSVAALYLLCLVGA